MAIERFRFDEQSSGCIEGDILDREGVAVPASSLTGATLTLVDLSRGANNTGSPRPGVINGRDAQDVLNTNNVVIDEDGHFIWSIQPADNGMPDVLTEAEHAKVDCQQIWRHHAMFLFTWAGGQFPFECELDVVNLRLQV